MSFAHFIAPGKNVDLKDFDPDDHGGTDREEAVERLAKLGAELDKLQELLFAAHQHSLLVIFQARDTGGKDGAIRKLLSYINVQSVRVASFKVPTAEELSHDFLWRVHKQTPGKGEVVFFNRSHYEDVLVARVHELAPKDVIKGRYEKINAFENLLVNEGTILLKFYLNISKDEQEQRLLDREKDPTKAWKLSVGDWEEREHWSDYTKAYEKALTECSTNWAPWRIIPANHKWFRDLAIAESIAEALRPYEKQWRDSLSQLGAKEKIALDAYRANRKVG